MFELHLITDYDTKRLRLLSTICAFAVGGLSLVQGCRSQVKVANLQTITNSIGMKLVHIPAGTFIMGTDKAPYHDPHQVTLDSYWMAAYETTNREFGQCKKRIRPPESKTDTQPVTRVTWHDADAFCRWLSKKEGKNYRLPTEAEWEYAARGGLAEKDWPWGDEGFTERATFGAGETTPVGTYPPNGFGLYDMAGNVEEWVSDWFAPSYYQRSPKRNPHGPAKSEKGELKVMRGGQYSVYEGYVWFRLPAPIKDTYSSRHRTDPDEGDGSGFRVVMEDPSATAKRQNKPGK